MVLPHSACPLTGLVTTIAPGLLPLACCPWPAAPDLLLLLQTLLLLIRWPSWAAVPPRSSACWRPSATAPPTRWEEVCSTRLPPVGSGLLPVMCAARHVRWHQCVTSMCDSTSLPHSGASSLHCSRWWWWWWWHSSSSGAARLRHP